MNDITCHGQDGSTWRYHAVHGVEHTPQETGWVLVVENSPTPIEPQAITASEVLGDLKAMMPDDETVPVIVRMKTEEMLTTLKARAALFPDEEPLLARLRTLGAELDELPPAEL